MAAHTQYCTDPEVVPEHLSSTPKYVVAVEEPKYTVGDSSLEVDYGREKPYDPVLAAAAISDSEVTQGSKGAQGKGWWRERQRNKWCVRLEAAIAALIVIAIVVGAVVGTEVQKHKSSSSSSSSSSTESDANEIPIGRKFTSSFALPGSNCSNTCGLSVSGYTAGVSQNLFYDGASGSISGSTSAWACGTCWQVNAETDGDGVPLTNATVITVHATTICPATAGNELCQMQNLTSSAVNVHNATVHFNLCEDTGTSVAAFGSSSIGLALGTVTRVECP